VSTTIGDVIRFCSNRYDRGKGCVSCPIQSSCCAPCGQGMEALERWRTGLIEAVDKINTIPAGA
jgi:hypothetical protein